MKRFTLRTDRLPAWARPFLADAQIEVDADGRAVLVLSGEGMLRFPTLDQLLATYRLSEGQLEQS